MNVALILAGGSGSRTEQSVPKQFLAIYDKPIIIYTLEAFQNHPDVDAMIVSCIDGWLDVLDGYARAYGITKLKWIVEGGENGQASARKIGEDAGARIEIGRRVLYVVGKVEKYLNTIAE